MPPQEHDPGRHRASSEAGAVAPAVDDEAFVHRPNATDFATTAAVDSSEQEDYETWLSRITADVVLDDPPEVCSFSYGSNREQNAPDLWDDASGDTVATAEDASGGSFASDSDEDSTDATLVPAQASVVRHPPIQPSTLVDTTAEPILSNTRPSAPVDQPQTDAAAANAPLPACASAKRKSVRFESVELIELPITIGDNPSVSGGPPITVDWTCQKRHSCNLDLFEEVRHSIKQQQQQQLRQKQQKRHSGDGTLVSPHTAIRKLSSKKRFQLLYNNGHSIQDMKAAAEQAQYIKQQRRSSAQAYQMQQQTIQQVIAFLAEHDHLDRDDDSNSNSSSSDNEGKRQ